ncbi:MAG TPA: hypothetical protein PK651_10810 [Smithellaceae bacterium]|jgi:hypothetical protein|nr:hypothetical protein [Smithellaceae bacterium]
MNLKYLFPIIAQELEKRRFIIRFAAPFFFFLTALFRCYLESRVFAPRSYFSYYVALHHVLWYFSVILFIILTTHLIAKVAVEKLLWLMYGAVLLMLPIIIVMIQGKPMVADYLTGSFSEIITHIFTIYFTYKKNLPLTAEVIVIFIGMTVLGYLYSKSLLRSLALGAAVYIGGNLLAISWIIPYPNSKSIFNVYSSLLNHPFLSVVWLHAMTFFTFLTAGRARLIRGSFRYWLSASAIALLAGSIYMVIVKLSGWFTYPVDIFLTALPFWTTAFFIAIYRCRMRFALSHWFWIIGAAVLLLQWAVLGPIYFHVGMAAPLTQQQIWIMPR